jgi:hypothetical protein
MNNYLNYLTGVSGPKDAAQNFLHPSFLFDILS